MSSFLLPVTKSVSPQGKVNETARNVFIETSGFVAEPIANGKSLVITAEGWQYETVVDPDNFAAGLAGRDLTTSSYT